MEDEKMKMNTLIADNLKKLKKARNLTNKQLAETSGVPLNTLSKIICGITTNPTVNTLAALAQALHCQMWELFDDDMGSRKHLSKNESIVLEHYRNLSKEGRQMVRSQIKEFWDYEQAMIREEASVPYVEIPLYCLPTSAGTGQFLDSDDYEITAFPAEEVPGRANFAVRISGDSMEPKFHNDDIAFVQQTQDLKPGEVGIFILNGEGYIKELRQQEEGEGIYLHSLNERYAPIIVRASDDLRVVGRVQTL